MDRRLETLPPNDITTVKEILELGKDPGSVEIYSKNAYKQAKSTDEITRTDTVFLRENDVYVNAVHQFRDRHFDYGIRPEANLIVTARKLLEQIDRLLELDASGYQTLKDPTTGAYETKSECNIFFELDGPYSCMVLPASIEEGKLLEKRYAEFNSRGVGSWNSSLIKRFQSQVFHHFQDGSTLIDCGDDDAHNDTRGESLDWRHLLISLAIIAI